MTLNQVKLKWTLHLKRKLIQLIHHGHQHGAVQKFAIVKIEAERIKEAAPRCASARWEKLQSDVS